MTCTNIISSFKRGQVLDIASIWVENGQPVDLTGCTLTSSLRDADDNLIEDLVVTLLNQTTNKGRFVTAIDSTDWPLGRLKFDTRIEFLSGKVVNTPTVYIDVVEPPTRGEP